MKQVAHADVTLSTLSLGSESAAPVVMLHGLVSGNMATWYSALAIPLSRQHRVVLYDLRGHGDSSVPKRGFDLDSHARDLLAVIDDCLPGGHAVDLVGHSMGALIALRFTLTWPKRVRRLVLVDAPMPARCWVGPSLLAAECRDDLARWVAEQPGLGQSLQGRRRERLQRRMETLLFETSLVSDVLAMGSERDEALRACDNPVLLVYGRHSPCLAAGHHLAETLPNAHLTLVDGGHHVPVESPDALRALLQDFLAPETRLLAECG